MSKDITETHKRITNMKLIQLGIASIVDTNTGNGFPHYAGGIGIDYATAKNHAHKIRSRSVITLLQQFREMISSTLQSLQQRHEQRRDIERLTRLNDHMLEDIGLTRGDVSAAQLGQIDLSQLGARRNEGTSSPVVPLRNVAGIRGKADNRSAINEATYASAKCA
jgi:uncharacterized protein YjiS (DUF1127 family)